MYKILFLIALLPFTSCSQNNAGVVDDIGYSQTGGSTTISTSIETPSQSSSTIIPE